MLDPNEIAQVRHQVIAEMASIEEAIHSPVHGTYTHLCVLPDDGLIYTHQPCGRVLYEFSRRAHADEVE